MCISALTTNVIPNSSPIDKSKIVKPVIIYPGICSLFLCTIQDVDSDEHIMLAHRSCVYNLHNMELLTIHVRKKWLVYLFRYVKELLEFQ
jgi:hypothetical protein